MIADAPAHVLRLDRMPIAAAFAQLDRLAAPAGVARVILGLDPCALCLGMRTCPDCGGPCDVCAVRR